jgi:predicted short-subunit dehydrogenase-like oxidoreductase (DUF2520 family)
VTRVALIGLGRLGTSLGNALVRAGYEIAALADSDIRAARRARRMIGRGRATSDAAAAARDADLIIIAVPDGVIADVVHTLLASGPTWRGKTVFHTSGAESSERLEPLAAAGARVASFHPVQSFPKPTMPPSHFRGATFGLEGDPAALKTARAVVRNLGGRPIRLSPGNKTLYHAACVLASNPFIPLFDLAVETMVAAGFSVREAKTTLGPLVAGTLRNVKILDAADALTGPLPRLDFGTVEAHLKALRRVPQAREAYRTVGLEALELLKKRGVAAGPIRRLRSLLEEK